MPKFFDHRLFVLLSLSLQFGCGLQFPKEQDEKKEALPEPVISLGGRHTCVIDQDQKLLCWGRNQLGQVGNGLTNSLGEPAPLEVKWSEQDSPKLSILTLGYDHSCALSEDGVAYCWGSNQSGLIGIPTATSSVSQPAPFYHSNFSDLEFETLDSRGQHNCGISRDKKLYCWGRNDAGQLGNGSQVATHEPSLVNTTSLSSEEYFNTVSVGYRHTCAMTNLNRVFCFGRNNERQLGNGSTTNTFTTPSLVLLNSLQNDEFPKQLSAGYYNSCVITNQDRTLCWGSNSQGAMGQGASTPSTFSTPTLVSLGLIEGEYFRSISNGFYFSCGVTNLDQLYCWGRNSSGQLGDGTTTDRNRPTRVLLDLKIESISTGDYHTCAITQKNDLYCWGLNQHGQLGIGDLSIPNTTTPTFVKSLGKQEKEKPLE